MTKRSKLEQVNKWNKPKFMPKENLFWPGGNIDAKAQADYQANPWNYTQDSSDYMAGYVNDNGSTNFTKTGPSITEQYQAQNAGNNINWGGVASAGVSMIPSEKYTVNDSTFERGVWDSLDLMYGLTGGQKGYKSDLGEGLSNSGVALTKTGNPYLMLAGAALKIGGDFANAIGGTKTDEQEPALKDNIYYLQNYTSNAGSFDGLQNIGSTMNYSDMYSYNKNWASRKTRNKVREQNAALKKQYENSTAWAQNSLDNNIMNIKKDQINNALANYSADGGYLDMSPLYDMPAVMVDYMKDYTRAKQNTADAKNNNMTSMFAGVPSTMFARGGKIHINPKNRGKFNATKKRTGKTTAQLAHSKNPLTRKRAIFAMNARKWNHKHDLGGPMFIGSLPQAGIFDLGGDIQMNGGDFTDGLVQINAGLSHEMNPYDGVQMGVDSEGTPNLVEEGETVFDDYVFSNRIELDEKALEAFHLPKDKPMSYSDASKLLEKKSEVVEKPNDPIAMAGFKAMIATLRDNQERQKQEMEAQQAQEAFASLSPEEQIAVMQNAAQPEQMTEEEAMQEPSPEEMLGQQQMAPEEQMVPDELSQMQANVSALGGELVKASDVNANVFSKGGKSRKAAAKYNKDWFIKQAKALGMIEPDATDIDDFDFDSDDPEANLINFNALFRDYQKNKALDTYRKGQRQAKKNELFGTNGLYSYSDDKSKIYKNRVNEADRIGWINSNYTGALDDNGNYLGFLSQDDYDKLSPADKEAYRRINERAGDRMYDYNGRLIKDLYSGTEDELLDSFNDDYEANFKWDPNDAQALSYPLNSDPSALSYLRYAPIFGSLQGLMESYREPDYSRARAVQEAGQYPVRQVSGSYSPTYLTYRPMDIWQEQNRMDANARATERAIMNSTNPAKYAGIIANAYNNQQAAGDLFARGLQYNDAREAQVAQHNAGENRVGASLANQAEMANQNAQLRAAQDAARYKVYGLQMMDDIDARLAEARNQNATNFFTSLGNVGEEAYDTDRLKWLEDVGVLKSDYWNRKMSKNGGKINRRK